jgi:hypothetical protein
MHSTRFAQVQRETYGLQYHPQVATLLKFYEQNIVLRLSDSGSLMFLGWWERVVHLQLQNCQWRIESPLFLLFYHQDEAEVLARILAGQLHAFFALEGFMLSEANLTSCYRLFATSSRWSPKPQSSDLWVWGSCFFQIVPPCSIVRLQVHLQHRKVQSPRPCFLELLLKV